MIRIDHELGQGARLAARCAAEHCSVRERDRLRLLLIGALHNQLLWRWLWRASAKGCSDDENTDNLSVHLIAPLLLRHAVLAQASCHCADQLMPGQIGLCFPGDTNSAGATHAERQAAKASAD